MSHKIYIWVLVVFSLLLLSSAAQATPMTWGDKVTKPLSWAKNSTINLFIQKDPKGLDRDKLLKEGIERWKKTLSDRMITLNVTIGDVPQGTKNVVKYTFEADGFKSGDHELGPGDKDDGIGTAVSDGEKLLGGNGHIRNELPAGTDDEKNFLKNLGEHEMTHVLGLADDDNGSVTNHSQPTTARDLNDQDKKEVNTLYGTASTGGASKPQGMVTPNGGDSSLAFFNYSFNFLAANAVADPLDPEHVSLITMGIDPDIVLGFDLPDGWIGIIPVLPVDINDPFFSEGYMLDGSGDIPPWDSTLPMSYIAFRTSVAEALRDGLPADFDPALSLNNPRFDITIYTTDKVQNGNIDIWSGGNLQTVFGPHPVPEPASLSLLGAGFLGLFGLRRKVKK